jgi:hypothetical protein
MEIFITDGSSGYRALYKCRNGCSYFKGSGYGEEEEIKEFNIYNGGYLFSYWDGELVIVNEKYECMKILLKDIKRSKLNKLIKGIGELLIFA